MALTEPQVVALEMEKVKDDEVPVLFEREDQFLSSIEKRGVEIISNRDMRIPLEIRPGGKSGHYDPAGGGLGRGSAPEFDKALVNTVHLKHAVEIHHKADIATNDRRKAILSAFKRSLATGLAEFRRANEALLMTAGNGVLATITTVDTATTPGKDIYTCTTDGFGVKLLRYGQDVNIYNAALTTQRTNVTMGTIDLYDVDTDTVRLSGNVAGAVAGDKIVIGGVTGPTPTSILGVRYHHNNSSTGSWLGFNRADFPEVRANRVSAGGDFALPFARLAINKIGRRLGMTARGKKLTAWMNPAQKASYEEIGQLVSIIQKQAKAESLDMYFDAMQMAGAPVKESFFWNDQYIDFVNPSIWGRGVMEEIGFYGDKHGKKIFEARSTDGGVAASWLYYLVTSYQVFIDNPPAASYISDLSKPAVTDLRYAQVLT